MRYGLCLSFKCSLVFIVFYTDICIYWLINCRSLHTSLNHYKINLVLEISTKRNTCFVYVPPVRNGEVSL